MPLCHDREVDRPRRQKQIGARQTTMRKIAQHQRPEPWQEQFHDAHLNLQLKGVMPFGRMHKSGLYLGGTSLMSYGSATFGMGAPWADAAFGGAKYPLFPTVYPPLCTSLSTASRIIPVHRGYTGFCVARRDGCALLPFRGARGRQEARANMVPSGLQESRVCLCGMGEPHGPVMADRSPPEKGRKRPRPGAEQAYRVANPREAEDQTGTGKTA